MFFTRIGFWIAWLLVILGGMHTTMGVLQAFGTETAEDQAAAARYILRAATTSEVIDEGMFTIFVGITLGILAEISRSTFKNHEK